MDVSYLLTQPTFMGTLPTFFNTIFDANTPNIFVYNFAFMHPPLSYTPLYM